MKVVELVLLVVLGVLASGKCREVTVAVSGNLTFTPSLLSVQQGDTVAFVWAGPDLHSVTRGSPTAQGKIQCQVTGASVSPVFDSGLQKAPFRFVLNITEKAGFLKGERYDFIDVANCQQFGAVGFISVSSVAGNTCYDAKTRAECINVAATPTSGCCVWCGKNETVNNVSTISGQCYEPPWSGKTNCAYEIQTFADFGCPAAFNQGSCQCTGKGGRLGVSVLFLMLTVLAFALL